jgi:uncharacterized repeat protein (TIGR01451 family)
MNKSIRTSLLSILILVLSACNLFGPPATATVTLTVQTQTGAMTFSQVGEVINYNYVVTNTGTSQLAGPVIILDGAKQVTCPELNTLGDLDNNLDPNETVTCTAAYSITESDLNTGSVTNVATATVGGVTSNQTGITLTRSAGTPTPSAVLTLTKTASSQTFGQVGQTITYTYVITNLGTTPLGPDQFTITDNKLSAPLNCGPAGTTIAPNQPLNCSSPYIVTQADMTLPSLTNTATATGAGHTSAPATTTITNLTAPAIQTPTGVTTIVPPVGNLSPGSTIQHQVAVGEWLIQIGRCYGATFEELRDANPQIADPDFILPSMIVTVPRIGSAGRIYGPPCITFHTVQSGDTWASIAQRYNADVAVLQRANPGGLVVGTPAKIPLNSAGAVSVTAVPGVTPTPTSTTVAAQRITFSPGQTTANVIGVINPNQTLQYVVSASAGQVLSIRLTAPANEVAVGVNGPTGLALKPLDPTPTWNTTIIASGDHTINIASVLGNSSKSYTLEVSLTSAVIATPTTTIIPTNTTAP